MRATEGDFAAMWHAGIINDKTDELAARFILWREAKRDPLVVERLDLKVQPYRVPGCAPLGIPDHIGHAPPDGSLGAVLEEMTDAERAALRERILTNPKVASWLA